MAKELKKESQIKSTILENLGKEKERRKYIILGVIALFLVMRIILKPFPYFYHIIGGYLIVLFLIIPITSYLSNRPNIGLKMARLIVGLMVFAELMALSAVLYLFMPVAVFYQMRISIISIPFFLLYAVLIHPLLISKRVNDFFYLFSLAILITLSILEYTGRYPAYSNYPILESPLQHLRVAIIPVAIALFVFLIIRSSIDQFWGRFSRANIELKDINVGLEEKVKERTIELQKKSEELGEAKNVLEIRVAARTRELKEFAEKLEENIELRTRELQERIDELETFHKLTVGRELKMIELKEEISGLKEQLMKKL
ncbi:hypothetical protein KJ562_00535 [Patescibacteria group bacterium]|nr:hypothetical protein [Patescibacteria group bacterium]MBU4162033.1 hypothetical protein [Patescibacteria group bacterium]